LQTKPWIKHTDVIKIPKTNTKPNCSDNVHLSLLENGEHLNFRIPVSISFNENGVYVNQTRKGHLVAVKNRENSSLRSNSESNIMALTGFCLTLPSVSSHKKLVL
jgi:hypothetical protein